MNLAVQKANSQYPIALVSRRDQRPIASSFNFKHAAIYSKMTAAEQLAGFFEERIEVGVARGIMSDDQLLDFCFFGYGGCLVCCAMKGVGSGLRILMQKGCLMVQQTHLLDVLYQSFVIGGIGAKSKRARTS